MMGGSMGATAPDQPTETDDAAVGPKAAEHKAKRGKASGAMGVSEFLAQGGGAQLPRGQQGKKERERSKRALGQSHQPEWKSEAEMVLRQQYDS